MARSIDAPVREEGPSPKQDMGLVPGQLLKALQERIVYPSCAELVDEFVVVDRLLLAIAGDSALHVPRRYDLRLLAIGLSGGLDFWGS